MNRRYWKAWQSSVGLHVLLIGLIVLLNPERRVQRRPLRIDLSCQSASRTVASDNSPSVQSRRRAEPVKKIEPSLPITPQHMVTEPDDLPLQAVSERPQLFEEKEVIPEAAGQVYNDGPGSSTEEEEGVGTSSDSNGDQLSAAGGDAGNELQQIYLREHFLYIRELIMKGLGYPALARRMGWSGELTVTFWVREDGTVHNLRILKSSGRSVLDNHALAAVSRAAPFPQPPVSAEIVMPILYRLN